MTTLEKGKGDKMMDAGVCCEGDFPWNVCIGRTMKLLPTCKHYLC